LSALPSWVHINHITPLGCPSQLGLLVSRWATSFRPVFALLGVFGASRHLHSLESAFASHSFGVHNLETGIKVLDLSAPYKCQADPVNPNHFLAGVNTF